MLQVIHIYLRLKPSKDTPRLLISTAGSDQKVKVTKRLNDNVMWVDWGLKKMRENMNNELGNVKTLFQC